MRKKNAGFHPSRQYFHFILNEECDPEGLIAYFWVFLLIHELITCFLFLHIPNLIYSKNMEAQEIP
jgi:hypothetical protein